MEHFAKNTSLELQRDEQLVSLARQGHNEAFNVLYLRYLPKVRSMAYPFQGLGLDLEDLIQEATIGFFSAIEAYNGSTPFSAFCYVCMRRVLITLLRSKSKKSTVPQNSIIYDCDFITAQPTTEPEQAYLAKESYALLKQRIATQLSPFEQQVLTLYLQGASYSEIAATLGKSQKSVGNALQRIRAKLRNF